MLQKIVKIGTPRQAKHAVRCIHTLCHNSNKIFDQIFTHLKKNMDLDSPNFLTSLVAIGHMTQLCPSEFAPAVKNIVSRFIVKELLMQDRVRGLPVGVFLVLLMDCTMKCSICYRVLVGAVQKAGVLIICCRRRPRLR